MKPGPQRLAVRHSLTVDALASSIQRMPFETSNFGAWLALKLGGDQEGRRKARKLCEILAVAALHYLLDPSDDIIEGMLGGSKVPNMDLARRLFKAGIEHALGQHLCGLRGPEYDERISNGACDPRRYVTTTASAS